MFENNPFSNNPFSTNGGSTSSPASNLFHDAGGEDIVRLDKLLTAAEDAIKYGDFEGDRFNKGADSFLEEIIETLPREVWAQNPRFYLVKLMITHRVTTDRELAAIGEELLASIDFRRARDYAAGGDPAIAARIEAIAAETKQNQLSMIQEMFEIKEDGHGAYVLVKAKKIPEHLVIPSNYFSKIGEDAFSGCRSLKSVIIPDGVTKIDGGAFEDCTSLVSVTIPNSVTDMGNAVFSGCTSLTSVSLSDNLSDISESLFEDCSSLTAVTIPDSVDAILAYAFYRCTSLTSITIPEKVWTIHDSAFSCCTSLTSVTISNKFCAGWTTRDIREDGLHEDIFSRCYALKTITLPERLRAFEDELRPNCDCKMIYT